MSIALLIESEIESGKEQTLLVPTNSDVLIFHRLSNGQRGRGQRWQLVENTSQLPTDKVTAEPVGVVITERDINNAQVGVVTALATKALALAPTPTESTQSHDTLVSDLRERLFEGDQTLNAFIRDARRSTPIALKPITQSDNGFIAISSTLEQAPVENVIAMPNRSVLTELASVPDRKWADTYLNRKMFGKIDFDFLDTAKARKRNVLIRGGAGSGKTMCVLAWASSRGYRYYNVSANAGLEPSHLFGAWTPTEQAGVFRWQDGPVTDLVRNGGVLLLNEIDFIPERITTVLFGLLDDRREIQLLEHGGEVIKAHPDLVVIGDHNPNYRGSRPMNQAWKDRFAHKLEFDYDSTIERKLIKSPALLEVANNLRANALKGEIDTPISTRGLIAFCENAQDLGIDYAISSYVNGFSDDERNGVALVFDTAKANIAKDFGITIEVGKIQVDEEGDR